MEAGINDDTAVTDGLEPTPTNVEHVAVKGRKMGGHSDGPINSLPAIPNG